MLEEYALNMSNDLLTKLFHLVYAAEVQGEMVENVDFCSKMDLLDAFRKIYINKKRKKAKMYLRREQLEYLHIRILYHNVYNEEWQVQKVTI